MPSKGTPRHAIRIPDVLWHEFQAATQQAGTNPSVVIRRLVRGWVDENKETTVNDVNALPGTEWGTDHWGEIMSEPTEGHARGVARITGAKVYSRSPMGQWVEA